MRCVDVIQELATPSDMRDAAALVEHLSRCSSCAAFADHAARLDRLWEATRPPESASEVWDNLWLRVAHSLDGSTPQAVASSAQPAFRNGSTSASVLTSDVKSPERSPNQALRSRPWEKFGVIRLSQAASVLLIAGFTWWFFVPSKHSLASVDIEPGQMVVILADPNGPSVVDRTSNAAAVDVDYAHVDWYGDERYFDWPQVFNEVEFLAKPRVAMKE